ncbi:MAG: hypothetical protein J5449_06795 [Oscillospiraceae bacterium]|nr:hypothetical protein [Oscillospiraceae bacterium]
MGKRKKPARKDDIELRVDREKRLCGQFDKTGVKKFEAPSKKMGVRVVDDCAKEHIM